MYQLSHTHVHSLSRTHEHTTGYGTGDYPPKSATFIAGSLAAHRASIVARTQYFVTHILLSNLIVVMC